MSLFDNFGLVAIRIQAYSRRMDTEVEAWRAGDVGPALRELRLSVGVTQTELAQTALVGRAWLNAFELGSKESAPLNMVMRVAEALGTDIRLTRRKKPLLQTEPTEHFDLDAHIESFGVTR